MPWTEEQKRIGCAELQRRRTTETPDTRRNAFLKALFAAMGAFFLSSILIWAACHGSTPRIRLEGALSLLIATTLMLVASMLAYVRFLDWRRKRGANPETLFLDKS